MIISHSKKFIFIHTYKVAGSSIREKFRKYSFGRSKINRSLSYLGLRPDVFSSDFKNHVSALDVRTAIGNELFNSYFKFAFVRNPWDWQVSLYHFARQTPDHFQHHLISKMDFTEYIKWRVHEDLHLQKEFVCDLEGCIIVDFVGKFENITNDFASVCQRIGFRQQISLGRKNPSKHKHYTEYYSFETENLVREAFAADIKLFDYTFK